MKLTEYSKNLFYTGLSEYTVPKEWADVMFNYLVLGLPPGSFFTALLANDAMAAIGHSHPANTIEALKNLVSWIVNNLPKDVGYGSYKKVDEWIRMSTNQRREVLESRMLVYSEQDEIMMVLKGEKTHQPLFW